MASPCSRGAASSASAEFRWASSPRCTASKRMCCMGCSAARRACRFGPRTPRATRPRRPCSAHSTSTSRLVSRQGRAWRTKASSPRIRIKSIVGAAIAAISVTGLPEQGHGAPAAAIAAIAAPTVAGPGLLVVAEAAQRGFVVGPAGAHAHEGFQEDLAAEQALHRHPRLGPDLAQAGAALADHDRLLAIALDPDHGADTRQRPGLRSLLAEAFDLDRGRVRQLRAELAHQLL